jgi:hypothetical protein
MKPIVKWVCNMSIAGVLVIAAAEIPAQASDVEPTSKRARVLMTQAPVTPESAQSIKPISESARVLVGHWRKTTIVFEQPEDEHLLLHADGTAENWVVTASSHSAPTTGTWNVEGKMLNLLLEGHEHISRPFTIYEEQLVFPNIPNRRRFWEKIVR